MKFEKKINLDDILDRNLHILNDDEKLFCKVISDIYGLNINRIERSAIGVSTRFVKTKNGIKQLYSRYIMKGDLDSGSKEYIDELRISASDFNKYVLNDFMKQ